MERKITQYLQEWQHRFDRKPLIIRGARQVGKTYIVEEFGKTNFETIVKINFEETPSVNNLFLNNDVVTLLANLEVFTGKRIEPQTTLLFFDEIQVCPKAIVSLRYFYEKIPDLHVIATGSLLDFALNEINYSMPVGRLEFAYMHPLNYYEFLTALKQEQLIDFLGKYQLHNEIPLAIHQKLINYLRLYFFIGGMPEAVSIYAKTQKLIDVERIHENILQSLKFDFSKYGTSGQQEIMSRLLKYIPTSIGDKFKYSNFDSSIRSNNIRTSLSLLEKSRILHLVKATHANGIPLGSNVIEKKFKPLFIDIGLMNNLLQLSMVDLTQLVLNNEGKLAEQYIGQELLNVYETFRERKLYYWMREKRNAEAEIDYVIQINNKIIPIEVKAGKTGRLRSLQVFMAEKKGNLALRFNSNVPSINRVDSEIILGKEKKKIQYTLISLPLYLLLEHRRLISEHGNGFGIY